MYSIRSSLLPVLTYRGLGALISDDLLIRTSEGATTGSHLIVSQMVQYQTLYIHTHNAMNKTCGNWKIITLVFRLAISNS